jgi:capsular polysaccharide biosynthesis protein
MRYLYLKSAVRRLWVIALCAVLAAAAGYIHAHRSPKLYTATAQLVFDSNDSVAQLLGLNSAVSSQEATSAGATQVALASLPVLATLSEKALGSTVPPGGISFKVAAEGESNLATVSATARSPAVAARAANVYSQEVIDYTASQLTSGVTKAISQLSNQIARLRRSGASGTELALLHNNLAELEEIAAVQPVNVSLAQAATAPASPSSPHPARDGVLGLLIGAVIGLIAALIAGLLDPKLRTLSEVSGPPGFVMMPWTAKRSARHTEGWEQPAEGARRALTSVLAEAGPHKHPGGAHVVCLTSSAQPADIRANRQIAWDLACASALLGKTASSALLDLSGALHASGLVNEPADVGWDDSLEAGASIDTAITVVRLGPPGPDDRRALDVILSRAAHEPWAHTEPDIRGLTTALANRYRYLFILAPAVDEMGSSSFLLEYADIVLASSVLNKSSRSATVRLVESLSSVRTDRVVLFGATRA